MRLSFFSHGPHTLIPVTTVVKDVLGSGRHGILSLGSVHWHYECNKTTDHYSAIKSTEIGYHSTIWDIGASTPRTRYVRLFAKPNDRYQQCGANSEIGDSLNAKPIGKWAFQYLGRSLCLCIGVVTVAWNICPENSYGNMRLQSRFSTGRLFSFTIQFSPRSLCWKDIFPD